MVKIACSLIELPLKTNNSMSYIHICFYSNERKYYKKSFYEFINPMKKSTYCILIIISLTLDLFAADALETGKEWLDISQEYKNEILQHLEDSKQFTEKQLDIVADCLDESSISEVINCFSKGGIDDAIALISGIKDQLGTIRERICGEDHLGNKDKCEQFSDSLLVLTKDLKTAWSSALEKGKKYLENKNQLLFMKRKICKKIDQEGCYQWLNERIEIKCDPKKIGNDPAVIKQCKLDVADEVWSKLNQ